MAQHNATTLHERRALPDAGAKAGADSYSAAIATADNYTRWILDGFRPWIGQRLLEVGLGHGGYRRLLPHGIDYLGVDIDAGCVAAARALHRDGTYLVGDVTDPRLAAQVATAGIDTVLCVNVLEHIAEDADAVRNLVGLLAPGGHLLILVPAHMALYSDLDRMAGHLRRYTLSDLPRLLGACGTVVRARYFNAVGGVGWWVNKAARHGSLNDPAVNTQIVLFDRWVVPLARLVDPLLRPWFGQSLVCVVRKP